MAVSQYTVKRGDTLLKICRNPDYASSIAGSTVTAKVDTLVKINNIKNRDLIYVGQVLKFSDGSTSSSGATSSPEKKVVTAAEVTGPALQADDTSGRSVYVSWEWTRENTKGYQYRWSQLINGIWTASDGSIDIPEDTPKDKYGEYCYATHKADDNATKIRFQVRPVSATYETTSGNTKVDKPYWEDQEWSAVKEYDFANNPPLTPPVPSVKIDDLKLTAFIENIDAAKLDAKYVEFNLVKNNTSSVETSPSATIDTTGNYVSYQFSVAYGAEYKVRARSVSANGKKSGWSEFSGNSGTRPSAPKSITTYRRNKRSDGSISAFLEWIAVTNAEYYIVEYTTVREDFETAVQNLTKVETEDARTSIEITGIEAGHDYFFRVKAARKDEGESEPTDIVTIPIGEPPAAPTTWSSANSAFVGETMELNWTHNARDGSAQTFAQLSMKINDGDWYEFTFTNSTNSTTGEQTDVSTFSYGRAISYKGELRVELDTTVLALKNAKVQWKVRTAGVTDAFSDTDWSVDRTIYIYEKPTLALSVTSDLAGSNLVETLTGFPFYIRGEVELDSYELQKPIGYQLRVVSNDFYVTVDDAGRTKTINPGDAVYSKYFDTDEILIVEMSASNVDLESGMTYTVYCDADMSTGLSVEQSYDFSVSWSEVSYTIGANINVSEESFMAAINPYCVDPDGNLVENVTLSVYRREYDGTLTEVATDIPNNGTSVTDPHPALDYARYRLVAKDTVTGAISFYDMPGHRIGCTSVIIQWDEEWSRFDVADENSVEGPPWSGSMLILPYNVSISDERSRDVSLVSYAGRERPVSYHGTQISESSKWSTDIPKTDTETIYALRRLSLWAGNAYVREPSGMGYWATVVPSFNVKYDAVTIPVTLDITRVEGGV